MEERHCFILMDGELLLKPATKWSTCTFNSSSASQVLGKDCPLSPVISPFTRGVANTTWSGLQSHEESAGLRWCGIDVLLLNPLVIHDMRCPVGVMEGCNETYFISDEIISITRRLRIIHSR